MPAPITSPYPSQALKSPAPAQLVAAPSYTQATVAVAAFGRHLVGRPGWLESCVVRIGAAGTAGTTVLRFQRIPAGSLVAADIGAGTITIDNADADGGVRIVPIGIDVAPGDVIHCNVTTAPTGGTNLEYAPQILQKF